MRGYRSKLKAVRRKKKNGTSYWAARGFVPVRRPDGSFARRRVEHGLGGHTAAARQAEVDKLNQGYEERALAVPLTFSRAYLNYIEHGCVPLYAEKILRGVGGVPGLGERQCHEIDDTVMVELSRAMFGANPNPAYVNRHLYTPVLAILRMNLKERAPQLARPKGYKSSPPVQIPDKSWFRAVIPHMGPDTVALVSFLTLHGRRLGDALGRKPADFAGEEAVAEIDGKHRSTFSGSLLIGRTKNGDAVFLELHPEVVRLIMAMPAWETRRWLFRDGPTSGSNARADILRACLLASGHDLVTAKRIVAKPSEHRETIENLAVPYFSPHELGRHAFATRMLREGYSLQYVKDAGGWKSIEVLSRLYGHLERKEWTAGVHRVADVFFGEISRVPGGKVEAQIPQIEHATPEIAGESVCL